MTDPGFGEKGGSKAQIKLLPLHAICWSNVKHTTQLKLGRCIWRSTSVISNRTDTTWNHRLLQYTLHFWGRIQ